MLSYWKLTKQKNQKIIIQVFKKYLLSIKLRLIILGDGEKYLEIKQIKLLNLKDKVQLTHSDKVYDYIEALCSSFIFMGRSWICYD